MSTLYRFLTTSTFPLVRFICLFSSKNDLSLYTTQALNKYINTTFLDTVQFNFTFANDALLPWMEACQIFF